MQTPIRVLFASALVVSALAPSLSHAAHFVDQTKMRASDTRAQTPDRAAAAKAWDQTFKFYGSGNTSVPAIGIDKDDSRLKYK